MSPPKPPRAHDWKLLVKNIRVTLNQQDDAAGGSSNFILGYRGGRRRCLMAFTSTSIRRSVRPDQVQELSEKIDVLPPRHRPQQQLFGSSCCVLFSLVFLLTLSRCVCRQHQSSVYTTARRSSAEVQHPRPEEHAHSSLGPAVHLVSVATDGLSRGRVHCFSFQSVNICDAFLCLPFSRQRTERSFQRAQHSANERGRASGE